MKIGIITFHSSLNFGAVLQAINLFKFIKSKGEEPIIINYQPLRSKHLYQEQRQLHELLLNEHTNLTKRFDNPNDIFTILKEYRIQSLIFGSDAIWSYRKNKHDYLYFGCFLSELHKKLPAASIAAAIMGNHYRNLTKSDIYIIKNGIKNFDYISVRDKWAMHNVKFVRDGAIDLCPDPFFAKEINKIGFDKNKLPQSPYILLSGNKTTFNTKWVNKFKSIANSNGYAIGFLPMPEGIPSKIPVDFNIEYPISPIVWYNYIRNSSGYIGLRFHALMTCIINQRPFCSIDSYGKSNLIYKILNRFSPQLYNLLNSSSKINLLLKDAKIKGHLIRELGGIRIDSFKAINIYNELHSFEENLLYSYSINKKMIFENNVSKALNILKQAI